MKQIKFILPVLAFIILGITTAKAQQPLEFTNNSVCTVTAKLSIIGPNCTVPCSTPSISIPPGTTFINLPNCNGSAQSQFFRIRLDTPKGPVVVGIGCFPGEESATFAACDDATLTVTMESPVQAVIE